MIKTGTKQPTSSAPPVENELLNKQVPVSSVQQTITSSILDSDNLKSDIGWILNFVLNKYSNNSNCSLNIFKVMFFDSKIGGNV